MPKITIAPKTKCEISTVVTIDIQPNESARLQYRNRQQNNLKIVHCVHAAQPTDDTCNEKEDAIPKKISVEGVRSEPVVEDDEVVRILDGDQHQAIANFEINKYYKPFLSDSNEQKQPNVKAFDEESLHNETSSSLVESVSILSDTFTFDAVQRRHITEIRNPVESILNDIFSNVTLSNVAHEKPASENAFETSRNEDALQLRDLLDKIRNDKTSLELAIERRNMVEYVSKSDKSVSPVAQPSIQREKQFETATLNAPSSRKMKEDAIDKSIQCNDEMIQKKESTEQADDRLPKRKTKTRTKVRRALDEDLVRSPKFAKTLNSIRSSAKKLNFDGDGGKYKTATPEQIQKAAEKFLNSLIKGNKSTPPMRRDDDSDSDSLNSYILAPLKYRVIDDKIIQSQFNNILLENTCDMTSDSTIDPILPKRIVPSNDEMNASTSSSSIDLRMSNLSLGHKLLYNDTLQLAPPSNGHCDLLENISDGEVLSEGEIRAEE